MAYPPVGPYSLEAPAGRVSRTMEYAAYPSGYALAYVPFDPGSPALRLPPPPAPIPLPTPVNVPPPTKKDWKEYMNSIGSRLDTLYDAADKPLPPDPGGAPPPVQNPPARAGLSIQARPMQQTPQPVHHQPQPPVQQPRPPVQARPQQARPPIPPRPQTRKPVPPLSRPPAQAQPPSARPPGTRPPPRIPSSSRPVSYAPPSHPVWAAPPQHNPGVYGLYAIGSPYRPPPPMSSRPMSFPAAATAPLAPAPVRPPLFHSAPASSRPSGTGLAASGSGSRSGGGQLRQAKRVTSAPPTAGRASGVRPPAQGRKLVQTTLVGTPQKSSPRQGTKTTPAKAATPNAPSSAPQKKATPVIDLTADSDDSYTPSDEDSPVPPRRARHARAHSAQPRVSTPAKSRTPSVAASPSPGPTTPSASQAVQCAGFTRSGAPCKRMVKTGAPLLSRADDDEHVVGHYCKDHAGLVCAAAGFYWRDGRGKSGVWVQFDEYIPKDLGQQTQTLLRMTMESPLTAKELPGFLYAYELRTLKVPGTSYFKVGRTDNVPRRIGQWSNQCTSHVPTLRDIFPLKAPRRATGGLQRKPSAPGSLLPGAVKGGVDTRRMVPAVKRWERLVHLELADRAATLRAKEYDALAQPCPDCSATHKEIFSLKDGVGIRAYEKTVVDAINRWEGFIRAICD